MEKGLIDISKLLLHPKTIVETKGRSAPDNLTERCPN
jgi:hypothetical protein